jgi:hypothetical protein
VHYIAEENSVLLRNLCWRVCVPYLFFIDVNAAVLLQAMLMHTVLFALQGEQIISLEMSPMQYDIHLAFLQHMSCLLSFPV